MSTRRFGRVRDEGIIADVVRFIFLSSSNIHLLHLPSASLRRCQQVLARLVKDGKLKRFRYEGAYVYHVRPRTRKWRHDYEVTRFHFSLLKGLKSWEKIVIYKREYDLGYCVADAFYRIRNTRTGDISEFYLEVDMGSHVIDWAKYPPGTTVVFITPRDVEGGGWIKTNLEEVETKGLEILKKPSGSPVISGVYLDPKMC